MNTRPALTLVPPLICRRGRPRQGYGQWIAVFVDYVLVGSREAGAKHGYAPQTIRAMASRFGFTRRSTFSVPAEVIKREPTADDFAAAVENRMRHLTWAIDDLDGRDMSEATDEQWAAMLKPLIECELARDFVQRFGTAA